MDKFNLSFSNKISLIIFTLLFSNGYAQIDISKTYYIESLSSSKVIVSSDRNFINISDNMKDAHVNWIFEKVEGNFGRLVNSVNDNVLDFDESSQKLGFLYLTKASSKETQLWKIVEQDSGGVSIINKKFNWALDIMDDKTEQGSFVIAYPYHGKANQRWIREKEGRFFNFKSVSAEKLLNATPQADKKGAMLTQWTKATSEHKGWKFIPVGDNVYHIVDQATNMAIRLGDSSINDKIALELWSLDENTTKWRLTEISKGKYRISDMTDSLNFDIMLKNNQDGAPVMVYRLNNGLNQFWRLIPYQR